jgi:transposase InsO family protein
MITISQPYTLLKKETGAEFARKALLENLKINQGNVKKTAQDMNCSRNTVYLSLIKEKKNYLADELHLSKTLHPKTTKPEIVDLIAKRREETGFGKSRLRRHLISKDNLVIPESTIGKMLKIKGLARKKKRVRREYSRIKYLWDKILPFEQMEMDTKDILDKGTLPQEIYQHVLDSSFIPKWQWTVIDPVTRIRFLAWSYSRDWSCGQVFGKMVIWWLRSFGFNQKTIVWSDGGVEFNATQPGSFQKSCSDFWNPLGVQRKIIRKGHPEDNPFVERSHQTDDYEFYIPWLLRAKSEQDFIKLGAWWQKVYNIVRTHGGLDNLTPCQKLKSLGYPTPPEFCLFPTLILDRLTVLPQILEKPKSVQYHLDYDLINIY